MRFLKKIWNCQEPKTSVKYLTVLIFLKWQSCTMKMKSTFFYQFNIALHCVLLSWKHCTIASTFNLIEIESYVLFFWTFLYIHPKSKLTKRFGNICILFNLKYLILFFIKWNNQGQVWNWLGLQILKMALIARFAKELNEIFKVKEKA